MLVKTYIVQRASGEVVAVKLRFAEAHAIAKRCAPAAVLFGMADKSLDLNVAAHQNDHPSFSRLQLAAKN